MPSVVVQFGMTRTSNDLHGASALGETLREALRDALAVLLPVDCAGCGAADRSVCAACRAELLPRSTPITTTLPGGLRVASAARYEGVLRALVLALKEQGRTDVARPLRELLSPLLAQHPFAANAELVRVPPSLAAARERGYDPLAMLVRGQRTARLLHHVGDRGVAQKRLDLSARAANRRGAFVADGAVAGRTFVVLDDILTSGATLGAAVEAIHTANGRVVGAITLAATPRRVSTWRESAGS